MKSEEEKSFSISKLQMVELVDELECNRDFLLWVLRHYLSDEMEHTYVIALLCESYSISVKLQIEIKKILDSSPVLVRDEEFGEEVILDEQDVALLRAGIMTRHFTANELLSLSGVSTQLN